MRGQGRAGGRERRGGTLVGAIAQSLDPYGTLSASAREAASYVLSTCNDHRFRYEKGRTVLSRANSFFSWRLSRWKNALLHNSLISQARLLSSQVGQWELVRQLLFDSLRREPLGWLQISISREPSKQLNRLCPPDAKAPLSRHTPAP